MQKWNSRENFRIYSTLGTKIYSAMGTQIFHLTKIVFWAPKSYDELDGIKIFIILCSEILLIWTYDTL